MKGLYRIIMDIEVEPNSVIEKYKYLNRMDEAFGFLFYSIPPYLLYHIDSKKTPNDFWTMLSTLFGTHDEMMGQQLEVELMKLRQSDFDFIQEFFTKFKSVLLQLKMCQINKDNSQMVLSNLSKLGLDYNIFVSTFYSTRLALGASYKMPTLDVFVASLL